MIATCQILVDQYHGEVPREFDQLVELPGVGRKTANVVVSVLFGTPAIAVDTPVSYTHLTMGAGSINQYGPKLLAILEEGLQ